MTDTPTPADLTRTVEAVRATAPLVQCLTNVVVSGFTANVLLAAGAAPAMVDNPHEAGVLAGVAGGVLVNLGTPFDDTVEAMLAAAEAAGRGGRPWVLDPVAVGVLPWRSEVAARLLGLAPTIVRGNASEVLALAGGAGGRGVDSTDSPDAAAEAARHLAAAHATVVAVSGPVDLLTDGERLVRVANGHPWLTRVTGVGCALGALMAACAAAADDPLTAAVTATAWMNLAGEAAAAASGGPGSFAVALVDHLDALDAAGLAASVALG